MKNSLGNVLNPYLPEYEYIPDGEPHLFEGRVYVFGSHDRFLGNVFCQNDYVAYSAPENDLSDWRYEGIILSVMDDPRTRDGGHQFWAPDVVRGPDGRYYLYYCADNHCQPETIGVAVCDKPAGRYEFLGLVHDADGGIIGARPGDTGCFDPGVLVDDDGSIYLYSGHAAGCEAQLAWGDMKSTVMRLAPDMLTVVEGPKQLLGNFIEARGTSFEGHSFFEASSPRKIGGLYYFVYSSSQGHELCYATSDRPDGGFTYRGVIVSNADLFPGSPDQTPKNTFGNNHGGIVKIGDRYYIFYHRHTARSHFSRQGCAEPIEILPDGTIPQVRLTSAGLHGAPLPMRGTYPAACAAHLHGSKTPVMSFPDMGDDHPYFMQDAPDFEASLLLVRPNLRTPRQFIANGRNGFTATYRDFDMPGAPLTLTVRVRGTATGKLVLRTEDDSAPIGEIPLSPSADWTDVSAPLTPPRGTHGLVFSYAGPGAFDFLEFSFAER